MAAKGSARDNEPRDQPGVPGAVFTPRYLAMAAELRERILNGGLRPGDRLPSFSDMRTQFGSTVATVERIYGTLEKEGLVERRQGAGTFVAFPKPSRTGNIGLLGLELNSRQHFAYYTDLLDGIQMAVNAYDRHLIFFGTHQNWNSDAAAKVDGLLVFNIGESESALAGSPGVFQVPYVCVLSAGQNASSVLADDFGGARLATEHLVGLGHRRIGCLMEKRPQVVQLRKAGYTQALAEADIDADRSWIFETSEFSALPREHRTSYLEWGRANMRAWLDNGWTKTGCTALLAQNDMAALGAMQIMQGAGIHVPGDVSIIGFDGTQLTDFCLPRLTSIEIPLARIGEKSVETLIQRMEADETEAQALVLPTRLKMGDSTAPPLLN